MRFATKFRQEHRLCEVTLLLFPILRTPEDGFVVEFHLSRPAKLLLKLLDLEGNDITKSLEPFTQAELDKLYAEFLVFRGSENYGFYDHDRIYEEV